MAHNQNSQRQQGRPSHRPGLGGDGQTNPAPPQYGQSNAARHDVPRSPHISSPTHYPPREGGYVYSSHTTGPPVSGYPTQSYAHSTTSNEQSVNIPTSSPIGPNTPGNYYITQGQQGYNSSLTRSNVQASTQNVRQPVIQDTYRNFQSHHPSVPVPTTPSIGSLTNGVSNLSIAGRFNSANVPSMSDPASQERYQDTRSHQDTRQQTTRYNLNDRSRPNISVTTPALPPGTRNVEAPATPGSNADAPPMQAVYNIKNDGATLDRNYKIQHKDFFKVGRVFSILWHENQGAKGRKGTLISNVTKGKFGELIFSGIRRMVVVKESYQCAWCLPVATYGGQGVAKQDADASKHAIIHMRGTQPIRSPNEPEMTKKPIEVDPDMLDRTLDPMSRLNFGKVYTVEHNVKVLPVGMISPSSMLRFMSYARSEFKLEHST